MRSSGRSRRSTPEQTWTVSGKPHGARRSAFGLVLQSFEEVSETKCWCTRYRIPGSASWRGGGACREDAGGDRGGACCGARGCGKDPVTTKSGEVPFSLDFAPPWMRADFDGARPAWDGVVSWCGAKRRVRDARQPTTGVRRARPTAIAPRNDALSSHDMDRNLGLGLAFRARMSSGRLVRSAAMGRGVGTVRMRDPGVVSSDQHLSDLSGEGPSPVDSTGIVARADRILQALMKATREAESKDPASMPTLSTLALPRTR